MTPFCLSPDESNFTRPRFTSNKQTIHFHLCYFVCHINFTVLSVLSSVYRFCDRRTCSKFQYSRGPVLLVGLMTLYLTFWCLIIVIAFLMVGERGMCEYVCGVHRLITVDVVHCQYYLFAIFQLPCHPQVFPCSGRL